MSAVLMPADPAAVHDEVVHEGVSCEVGETATLEVTPSEADIAEMGGGYEVTEPLREDRRRAAIDLANYWPVRFRDPAGEAVCCLSGLAIKPGDMVYTAPGRIALASVVEAELDAARSNAIEETLHEMIREETAVSGQAIVDANPEIVSSDSPVVGDETPAAPSESSAGEADDSEHPAVAAAEAEFMEASVAVQEIELQIAELKSERKNLIELRDEAYQRLKLLRGDPDAAGDDEDEDSDEPDDGLTQTKLSLAGDGDCSCGDESPDVEMTITVPDSSSDCEVAQQMAARRADPEWWKSVPTTNLDLSSIRGMGPKKIEALLEVAPTIGKLEDLRAAVSQGKEKWPRGFGQATTDGLEDCILAWLTANRDAEVLGEKNGCGAEPGAPTHLWGQPIHPVAEALAEYGARKLEELDREIVGDGADDDSDPANDPTDLITPAEESAMAGDASMDTPEAEAEIAAISRRAEELKETGLPLSLCSNQGVWEDGRRAFSNGEQVDACNWTAGDNQDDWLRGWLYEADQFGG